MPADPEGQALNNNDNTQNNADENQEDTPPWKRKTKSQQDRDEQFNKLLKVAQQEDHPVELGLASISKQMQRSLNEEEQDELLDELRAVASNYFREKRRQRREVSSVVPSISTALLTPPPPPLLQVNERRPLQQVQQNLQENVQQATTSELGDMLFDVSSLPPMQGYNVELIRDSDGGTYMKM